MGPDGMDSQMLRGLSDDIARPLLIDFDQSWQLGELPKTGRMQMSSQYSRTARRVKSNQETTG